MNEAVDFIWQRSEAGYEAKTAPLRGPDGKVRKARFIVPKQRSDGGRLFAIRYHPFRHSGLFRNFAAKATDEAGALSFANSFGLLGGPAEQMIHRNGPVQVGDVLAVWLAEAWALRRAVALWTAVKSADPKRLSELISYREGSFYQYFVSEGARRHVMNLAATDPRLDGAPEGELLRPAAIFLQTTINNHLAGRVSPRLLWDHESGKLVLRMRPDSLLGALWLQFGQAVAGNKEFKACEQCDDWFEIGPGTGRRSTARFCSDRCRNRWHQKEKGARHG